MAKFIGNRCIPTPEGKWDKTKEYLGLSVVLDEKTGDSYTSKKVVPAGTELNNADYWVMSGQYNAQMALIKQQLNAMQNIPEGGTTADAALENIRIGADGTEYATPGDAVRGQVGALSEEIDRKTETLIKQTELETTWIEDAYIQKTSGKQIAFTSNDRLKYWASNFINIANMESIKPYSVSDVVGGAFYDEKQKFISDCVTNDICDIPITAKYYRYTKETITHKSDDSKVYGFVNNQNIAKMLGDVKEIGINISDTNTSLNELTETTNIGSTLLNAYLNGSWLTYRTGYVTRLVNISNLKSDLLIDASNNTRFRYALFKDIVTDVQDGAPILADYFKDAGDTCTHIVFNKFDIKEYKTLVIYLSSGTVVNFSARETNSKVLMQERIDDTDYMLMFDKLGICGDSLASGELVSSDLPAKDCYKRSWLSNIAKTTRAEVVHYSAGGSTCKSWFTTFSQKLAEEEIKPNAYYIALGSNDINESDYVIGTANDSIDSTTFAGKYKKIIEFVHTHAPNSTIFIMSLYRNTQRYTEMNNMLSKIAELYDYCYFINFAGKSDIVCTNNNDNYTSNSHFTTIGYSEVARNIKRITNSVIKNNMMDFKFFGYN